MKTAEVHTFVRKTPSIGIMFLASALASRVHDRVSLSHLDSPESLSHLDSSESLCLSHLNESDAPVLKVETVEMVAPETLRSSPQPEVAPLKEAKVESEVLPVKVATVIHDEPVTRDFKSVWDLDTAKDAFAALEASGMSKTAFAKAHGFGADRFKRWQDRV